ncbi:ACT domain-containing protein, partial [bacterium]|nr:ACT domain-containing protein [bacterium]
TTRNSHRELEAWVHPALVPEKHPLASVDNVFNAVYIEDDNLGPSLYYGRGAGALPTGSAVVADIVSCSRDILSGAVCRVPVGGSRQGPADRQHSSQLAQDNVSEFYVRVTARDRPGVLSKISGLLAKSEISISSVIQRGRELVDGGGVPIVMIIHEASYARMIQALSAIDAMDETLGKSFYMRILSEEKDQ